MLADGIAGPGGAVGGGIFNGGTLTLTSSTVSVNQTDATSGGSGGGIADTGAGNHDCTLREALGVANSLVGPDSINKCAQSKDNNVRFLTERDAFLGCRPTIDALIASPIVE